jgi:hypothetical protein
MSMNMDGPGAGVAVHEEQQQCRQAGGGGGEMFDSLCALVCV